MNPARKIFVSQKGHGCHIRTLVGQYHHPAMFTLYMVMVSITFAVTHVGRFQTAQPLGVRSPTFLLT